MPTTTLQQLRDKAYAIINEPQTSQTYPLAFMDLLLNEAQRKICSGSVINYQTKQMLVKWPLPFLDAFQPYMGADDMQVSVNANIGDTVLNTSDTSQYPSAGYVYIMGNIIQYTGKTSNTLTGIPATGVRSIQYPYTAGTAIKIVFQAPSTYNQLTRLIYNNSVAITPRDYRDTWYGQNDPRWASATTNQFASYGFTQNASFVSTTGTPAFYTIFEWQFLVAFNIGGSNTHFLLLYENAPTPMVNGTDTTTIPDDWAMSTIPYIAVSELFYNRGEEDRAMNINDNLGYSNVMSAYEWYQNTAGELVHNQAITSGAAEWLTL